jgi:serine/threonine-protein kinase RsbT
VNEDVRVPIESAEDVVVARGRGRNLATEIGLSKTEATLVATAISEVARNIVQYVGEGEIVLSSVSKDGREGIRVVARDSGPGIHDVAAAVGQGPPSKNRAGLGLPGARRLMDEFRIDSEVGRGTRVVMMKLKRV